jgi:ATP-dependent DNA ligase
MSKLTPQKTVLSTFLLSNSSLIPVDPFRTPWARRPYLGALLLAYYDADGKLVYAGRAGSGINDAELERLWRRLQPHATDTMPLDVPPPRGGRFGSPLVLSRVHWVRPELVAEVKFLTWTSDNLLRQVVYQGLRWHKMRQDLANSVPEINGNQLLMCCA